MVMFGNIFFLLTSTKNTGGTTTSGTTISDWAEENYITVLEAVLEGDWDTHYFETIRSTAIAVFRMMLGDYDPDLFPDTFSF